MYEANCMHEQLVRGPAAYAYSVGMLNGYGYDDYQKYATV